MLLMCAGVQTAACQERPQAQGQACEPQVTDQGMPCCLAYRLLIIPVQIGTSRQWHPATS